MCQRSVVTVRPSQSLTEPSDVLWRIWVGQKLWTSDVESKKKSPADFEIFYVPLATVSLQFMPDLTYDTRSPLLCLSKFDAFCVKAMQSLKIWHEFCSAVPQLLCRKISSESSYDSVKTWRGLTRFWVKFILFYNCDIFGGTITNTKVMIAYAQ